MKKPNVVHHGTVRIDFKFDELDGFFGGLALARIGTENFYIDHNGKRPFSLNASYMGRFKDGRALVATPVSKTNTPKYTGFGYSNNWYTACPKHE